MKTVRSAKCGTCHLIYCSDSDENREGVKHRELHFANYFNTSLPQQPLCHILT